MSTEVAGEVLSAGSPVRVVIRDEVRRYRCLLEDNIAIHLPCYWSRTAHAVVVAIARFRCACGVAHLIMALGDELLPLPGLTVDTGLGVSGMDRSLDAGRLPAPGGRLQ
jgi:hypothetical protein